MILKSGEALDTTLRTKHGLSRQSCSRLVFPDRLYALFHVLGDSAVNCILSLSNISVQFLGQSACTGLLTVRPKRAQQSVLIFSCSLSPRCFSPFSIVVTHTELDCHAFWNRNTRPRYIDSSVFYQGIRVSQLTVATCMVFRLYLSPGNV